MPERRLILHDEFLSFWKKKFLGGGPNRPPPPPLQAYGKLLYYLQLFKIFLFRKIHYFVASVSYKIRPN